MRGMAKSPVGRQPTSCDAGVLGHRRGYAASPKENLAHKRQQIMQEWFSSKVRIARKNNTLLRVVDENGTEELSAALLQLGILINIEGGRAWRYPGP